MNFTAGDIVRVKSGGPNMTYTGKKMSDGRLICEWFDSAGNPKRAGFAEKSLEKVVVAKAEDTKAR